jgi:single-strand DNA-binding protein
MINKVILVGYLGKDPIIRRTESGIPVATFSIATNESYKDKDGNWQEKTEWHNIVLWRMAAESAEKRLKKGSLVYIEGKLTTRSYQQDNITKYTTEVVGDTVRLLEKRENSGSYQNVPPPDEPPVSGKTYTTPNTGSNPIESVGEADDLPF